MGLSMQQQSSSAIRAIFEENIISDSIIELNGTEL
jgi:hypothetical protein